MAADLGTWPAEQATVLVKALQDAGITPDAKRTREGIRVTVADDQADKAHQTLVANMDAIARAARSPIQGPSRRRPRAGGGAPARRGGGGTPLGSERLQRLARPIGLLVIGLLLAAILPPALRLPLVVFTVAGVVYFIGKQTQAEGGGDDHRR